MNGRAIGLLVVLAAVAGCGGPAGPGRGAGTPDVHPSWESCAAATAGASPGIGGSHDALTLPRLADDFRPVAAVVCRSTMVRRAGGGEDLHAVEERADDVTDLVATLRLPDEKRTNGACTMELPYVPWLALLDEQGRWVRPGVPANACRKPRIEFREAFGRLKTRQVSSRVQAQIESDGAAAAGCSQSWADMVWVTGQEKLGRGNADLPAADAAVRLCVYQVPESERGGGKPGGQFRSGGPLDAATWAAARRLLAAAGPAEACSTPAAQFAVLHPPAGQIYVELDGCRRVLFETGGGSVLRQGGPELAKSLLS